MATNRFLTLANWFLRLSLAAGFLSAVADRFGMWGSAGHPNVAWGNWEAFLEFVAVLNWFMPSSLVPALGWLATIAEIVLAIGLIVGWKLRVIALLSGVLLLIFAATMMSSLGIKAPFDYSVFAAAAGAFLLAAENPQSPANSEGQLPRG